MVETMTKTTQYMDDIELHFTENEKGHKQENKKYFYRNQKDVGL